MTLNERIRKILEVSGFSSSEFADEIEVQRSSVSHITSGRNKPSLEFITKIKARFPEISWDWLINGEGEMKVIKLESGAEANENLRGTKTAALPDLFSLIDDNQFGITESEDKIQYDTSRESFKPNHNSEGRKISDSQRLENPNEKLITENIDKHDVRLKKIVMFYSNGKFESFEP
jgi:transcriptional regulator with XRE-family HTH domain